VSQETIAVKGGQIIENYELPESQKTGYIFDSWCYDIKGTTPYLGKKITKDLTLYAKYDIITYHISYELNGGSHVGTPPTIYDAEHPAALGVTQRIDYVWDGWYYEENFITPITTTEGNFADLKVYAKWNLIPDIGYEIDIDEDDQEIKLGESLQLHATTNTGGIINWQSLNTSIARVDSLGHVTVNEVGIVIIMASSANGSHHVSDSIIVNVIPWGFITISGFDDKQVIGLEEDVQLSATITSTLEELVDQELVWSTSDANLASISDGLVHPIAAGEVKITVQLANDSTIYGAITIYVSYGVTFISGIDPAYPQPTNLNYYRYGKKLTLKPAISKIGIFFDYWSENGKKIEVIPAGYLDHPYEVVGHWKYKYLLTGSATGGDYTYEDIYEHLNPNDFGMVSIENQDGPYYANVIHLIPGELKVISYQGEVKASVIVDYEAYCNVYYVTNGDFLGIFIETKYYSFVIYVDETGAEIYQDALFFIYPPHTYYASDPTPFLERGYSYTFFLDEEREIPFDFQTQVIAKQKYNYVFVKRTLIEYDIIYHLNEGEINSSVPFDESFNVEMLDIIRPDITRSGYNFAGWYSDPSLEEEEEEEDLVDDFSGASLIELVEENELHLYAKWEAI
jgi:uncharacterized repeat protein (TIGR02543 family)